jgi:cytochrome c-type biogenesis protein CcmE
VGLELMVKNYAKFAALIVVFLSTLVWLATTSASDAKTYYKTVAELSQMGDRAMGQRVRVGGDVEGGSIRQIRKETQFVLVQGKKRLKVIYTGTDPLPDTFKGGAQALADGKLGNDQCFRANHIQAKCASKYESKPELAPRAQANINSGKS